MYVVDGAQGPRPPKNRGFGSHFPYARATTLPYLTHFFLVQTASV